MSAKLSPNDAKWVVDARRDFIKRVGLKEIADQDAKIAALKRRGRPPTGVKEPWKELNISKATYYRRIRAL